MKQFSSTNDDKKDVKEEKSDEEEEMDKDLEEIILSMTEEER